MTQQAPVILWFRRDLRLADHRALSAAVQSGRPVIPVFIYDPLTQSLGAAAKFRLSLSLAALAADLAGLGSRLILRRGPALQVLRELAAELGAREIHWSRLYDPASKQRDIEVKSALQDAGFCCEIP